MRTLIIHHLECAWDFGYRKQGTSFELLCQDVVAHLQHVHYDKVILTRFEDDSFQDEHHYSGLSEFVDEIKIYGYMWCQEDVDNHVLGGGCSSDFVEGGSHSIYVYIDDWMRKLNGIIDICGAFEFECLEDLQIALDSLDLSYNKVWNLIV